MISLYNSVSEKCSKLITQSYSTSFSLGILMLNREFRKPIRNIYGFVRFADEIVDTFHHLDKQKLLEDFRGQTGLAIINKFSINPVLHSFQLTVNEFGIQEGLIDAFLNSMEMDLGKKSYETDSYSTYIYGSAEVVGLMCLQVFCKGNREEYSTLEPYARKLGAAFQKINFLRDIKSDYEERGRVYFPGVDINKNFDQKAKYEIEKDIQSDFEAALHGIRKLPKGSRLGVYIAYRYFYFLLKKIINQDAKKILHSRIRISNPQKILILIQGFLKHHLNII